MTMGPLEGRQIGGCNIIQKLGEGGMGAAYKAHHVGLDRIVVVKILHTQLSNDPEFLAGFQREAQAAAKLEHPRIVQVYDRGSQDNLHYIIMQYIDGESAEDVIKREKRIPQLKALQIIKAALEGLGEAHKHNIIHRDVKPSNILLGKDGTIRLSDFGLAVHSSQASSGTGLGTPLYVSPEQAWGADVDGRADIYSMGVTFFHMIAGEPPFNADNPADIIAMHVNNPPPDIRNYNPEISNMCAEVIMKMMAKRPDDRQQNVAELLTALNSPGMVMQQAEITGERTLDIGVAPNKTLPGVSPGTPTPMGLPTPGQPTPFPGQPAPGQITSPSPAPPPAAGDVHAQAMDPTEPLDRIEKVPAWKRLACTALWLLAGASAFGAGFVENPLLILAAIAMAGGGFFLVGFKSLGLSSPLALAAGCALLFGAGSYGIDPQVLSSTSGWRAAFLTAGLAAGLVPFFFEDCRAPKRQGAAVVCLIALSASVYLFALPPNLEASVLLRSRHAMSLPLLAGAALSVAAALMLLQSELDRTSRLLFSIPLVAAGVLVFHTAGGLERRPPLPKELEKPAPSRSGPRRGVMVVIVGDQAQPQEGDLAAQEQKAAEEKRQKLILEWNRKAHWKFAMNAPLKNAGRRLAKGSALAPAGLVLLLIGLVGAWRKPPIPHIDLTEE